MGLAFLQNLLKMQDLSDVYFPIPLLDLKEVYAYGVMDHLSWRRSAVEFLPGLVASGTYPEQHAPVQTAGVASVCALVLELVHALTEGCDRWTDHPYCISWTWVDEGAWAKTYRCVSWLRSMLDCLTRRYHTAENAAPSELFAQGQQRAHRPKPNHASDIVVPTGT